MFAELGEVRYARVSSEKNSGFVCFKDKEAASAAINQSQSLFMKGRPLFICQYQPREYRLLKIEEMFDRKAYEKQKTLESSQKCGDAFDLLKALGTLFTQV